MYKRGSTALIALFGNSLALTVVARLKRAQLAAPAYNHPYGVGSEPTNTGGVDVIIALTCLVLVLVAVALLVFIFQTIRYQPKTYQSRPISIQPQTRPAVRSQPLKSHSQPSYPRAQPTASRSKPSTPFPPKVSAKTKQLQSRLLTLLNGDRKTAERLLAQVQKANPDRSGEWWLEKVIHDLERDRRG